MKTKNILTGLVAIAVLVLPAISLANTYHFVDTSGNLQSMEANSPSEALRTAHQLGIHSGVVLITENSNQFTNQSVNQSTNQSTATNTTGSGNFYQFIDTSGNIQGVWAANPSVALATAFQLATHSGVVLVD